MVLPTSASSLYSIHSNHVTTKAQSGGDGNDTRLRAEAQDYPVSSWWGEGIGLRTRHLALVVVAGSVLRLFGRW